MEGVIYVSPRDLFLRVCDAHPELWREISGLLTERKRQLEKKIELLCLRDVEYRILYYMADLAKMFGARANGAEYSIPLSQGELASLIGATRETTSTTLNALARKGVIRLGRRQLIVPSIDGVLEAANRRTQTAKVS
jgi:CRP-like cAMP-binding protein